MKEEKNIEDTSKETKRIFPLEHWQGITLMLMAYDAFAIAASFLMALWFRFDSFNSIPAEYMSRYVRFLPICILGSITIFWGFRLYRSIWRFASYNELYRTVLATIATFIFHIAGINLFFGSMPRSYFVFGIVLQFILVIGVRFTYRFVLLLRGQLSDDGTLYRRVMIIGAGEAGQIILRDIKHSTQINERVYCMIDDNPNKWNRYIDGIPIVGGKDSIFEAVEKYTIEKIYVALPSATVEDRREILNICKETSCEVKSLPGLY